MGKRAMTDLGHGEAGDHLRDGAVGALRLHPRPRDEVILAPAVLLWVVLRNGMTSLRVTIMHAH